MRYPGVVGTALVEAQQLALNNGRCYHVAAILRRKGHVVKIGVNSNKTHPRFKRQFPDGSWASHMHAEMHVLRFAKPGDILEVVRFRRGSPALAIARPCKYCMQYIHEAGIKLVRYTNREGIWEEMKI